MNNIEILEEYIKELKLTPEELLKNDEIIKFIEYKEIQAIQNLIQENKELKEKMNFIHINNLNDIYEETLEKTFTKFIKSNMEKDYIPKSKVREKIDFLKEVLAFAETGRDEKATIQANLLKNIIIEMEKLLEE